MPQPPNIPKLHKAARVAKTAAATSTQSLRAAHAIACQDDPILALMLLDMIERASRIEQRLCDVVLLHDEARHNKRGTYPV